MYFLSPLKIVSVSYLLLTFTAAIQAQTNCSYSDLISKPNLVTNGDFENGNNGFASDYTYDNSATPSNPLSGGYYFVGPDASAVHFAWTSSDHTTGSGNFMIINGGSTPLSVWKQTIAVEPNTYYRFSAWLKNIVTKPQYAGYPLSYVELHINGNKVTDNIVLSDYPDVWVKLDTLWYSDNSTSVTLSVYDTSTDGNGNDFGLDDVSFKKCACSVKPDAGPNYTICKGDTVHINASSGGTYHWTSSTDLSDSTILNPYAYPRTSRTYYLIADSAGCQAKDSMKITVMPTLIINAGNNQQICIGDSAQLTATGGSHYVWSPSTGMNDSTIANPKVKPSATTQYVVKSNLGTCAFYDTVVVFVNTKPIVDAGTNKTICQNDSVRLSGTSSSAFYNWKSANGLTDTTILQPYAKPNQTTTYYLVADNAGCQNQDSVTITVIPALHLNAGPDKKMCLGDSMQLSVTGGNNYIWTPSGTLNDSSSANPKAGPASTTTYVVKSENSGCLNYDTIIVTVNPKPTVDVEDSISGCNGQSYSIKAVSSGATSYNWSPATGLSDPGILQPKLTLSSISKYVITATNNSTGCSGTDSLIVHSDSVNASFIADKNNESAPLKVRFTNQSYNATQYQWFFDNSMTTSSNETDPTYVFDKPGVYKVTLVATSAEGCVDSMEMIIKTFLTKSLFIPNAFTPNGDIVNEVFIVAYDEILYKKVEGSIWDRWGAKIYEFKMPNGKWWDGKYEDQYAPAGVYYYIITSEDIFGNIKGYKGTVTLLR